MSNEYLIIEDVAFETAIKEYLDLTDKENILLLDAKKIRKLDLSNLEITSIKGIEYLSRLSSLDLSFNQISDISYLKNLKLDYLNLKNCGNIREFSILAECEVKKYLKNLDLSGNFIESFDFLKNIEKLKVLYLNDMGFDDFSELPSLESLNKLYIEDNLLEEIENPPYLPEIKEIYLSRNQLTYIEGIEKLKTLEKIRISYNKIETILPLKHFKKLKKLYMSYNQIVDLTPLKDIEITEKLSIDKNFILDVEPIRHLINSKLDIFGLESTGIIRPTQEQIDIINYSFEDNDILKANAYAGTGKTTTAIQFIENYEITDSTKVLYLNFNKSVKEDVDRKMPDKLKKSVDVRTAHSLAWKYLKLGNNLNIYRNYNITATFIRDYLYFDVEDKKEALKNARIIEQFIKFYLNSDYSYQPENIKDAFEEFIKGDIRIKDRTDTELVKLLTDIVKVLVLLLDKFHNKEINFDFYLKLFHLTLRNHIAELNRRYQLLIFDEAQDASMVMFDTVNKMSCKKIFIGDSHQEIYSFRHAVNILNKIDVEPLELTNSFRFGKEIALLANKILSLKGIKTNIKGKGNDNILFYDVNNGMIAKKEIFAIIARTNTPLFDYAHIAFKEQKNIYFEGGLDKYPFASQRAKSIYYLYKMEFGKIRDSFIKQFNNIWKLKKYTMEAQDFQLFNLIQLVEKYGDYFYRAFLEIKSRVVKEKYEADIIFTTVHKSKGVEYDTVMIVDDFKIEPFRSSNDYEEVNLFYVAVTRAKKLLYLPKQYEGFLEIDIEKTIKSVNELLSSEPKKEDKRIIKIDLYDLTDFEKKLNRHYSLPMSKNASNSPEKLAIVMRMMKSGISLSDISAVTGIDIEILKNLL